MNYSLAVYCAGLLTAFVLTAATPASAGDSGGEAAQDLQTQMSRAMQGDVESQYRVGEIYEQGLGVSRDTAMAYLWYSKAARQGDARASSRLAVLDRTRESDAKERERVDAAMRALRQQSEQEIAAKQAAREKEKAAMEARVRRQAEHEAAARRAREKAATETTATRTRAEAPAKPSVTPPALTAPTSPPLPAEARAIEPVKPAAAAGSEKPKQPDNAEFSANPCAGPQARFRSICNM